MIRLSSFTLIKCLVNPPRLITSRIHCKIAQTFCSSLLCMNLLLSSKFKAIISKITLMHREIKCSNLEPHHKVTHYLNNSKCFLTSNSNSNNFKFSNSSSNNSNSNNNIVSKDKVRTIKVMLNKTRISNRRYNNSTSKSFINSSYFSSISRIKWVSISNNNSCKWCRVTKCK